MDVKGPVDEAIAQAEKEYHAGNYRGGVALLLPLLRAKDKLSPLQEYHVADCLSQSYHFLHDYKAALPHVQRTLGLAQELFGPRSEGHALALKELCKVHTGLKAFPEARKAIVEALAIMDELGLQQDEQYGSMLIERGDADCEEGQYKEPLVIYNKARAVLVQHKEGDNYGVLLNSMAICHKKLHEWNEAVALRTELVEHQRNLHGDHHPNYATALYNLAVLFANLKQFEEAIPRFEEVLPIFQRVYGDKHDNTLRVTNNLASACLAAQQRNRHVLDLGHNYSMCNQCGTVHEHMCKCDGCNRAWYCNTDCQLQHWPTHKPQCDVCIQCATVLTKIMRCSRCKKVKYCGAECSKAHWSEHKKECVKPTKK